MQSESRRQWPPALCMQFSPHRIFGGVIRFQYEQICKPGSVVNDHLSRPAVADRFKPPPENGRAGLLFSHGVAPDRVYSISMSPSDE